MGKKKAETETVPEPMIALVPLSQIEEAANNPRTLFDHDELVALGENMRAVGQIVPIGLRRLATDDGQPRYQIVDGARRFRAAQLAGMETIRAEIQQMDDRQANLQRLLAGLMRQALNPIEEAKAFDALLISGDVASVAELATLVRRSERAIYTQLELLELIDAAKDALINETISLSHATLIRSGHGPEEQAKVLAACWVDEQIDENDGAGYRPVRRLRSERELRAWVRQYLREDAAATPPEPTPAQASAVAHEVAVDEVLEEEPGNGTNDDTSPDPMPLDSDDDEPESTGERAGRLEEKRAAEASCERAEFEARLGHLRGCLSQMSDLGALKFVFATMRERLFGLLTRNGRLLGHVDGMSPQDVSAFLDGLDGCSLAGQTEIEVIARGVAMMTAVASMLENVWPNVKDRLVRFTEVYPKAAPEPAKKVRKKGVVKARAKAKPAKKIGVPQKTGVAKKTGGGWVKKGNEWIKKAGKK